MSMQQLTILQFLYLLMTYLGVMVLLPAAVFYPFFKGRSFGVKFIGYLTIGNFYVMNLVFLLELLHIANPVTLWMGVLVPAVAAICRIHWNSWAKSAITFAGEATYGVLVKTMGIRLLISKVLHALFQTLAERVKNALRHILEHPIDTLGTLMVAGVVLWQYGNVFYHYGYIATDTPVHNHWINAMCDNKIFVAGVYPFGMHCVLFFMNQAFGIEIMNLLRLMGLLQTLLIHFVLLIFLRTFCKNAGVAYGGVLLYALGSFWNINTNLRLFSTLPQEYGMIFILPGICFLFLFLESRRREEDTRSWRAESTLELLLFGMNFAMTLMVHFYDTMIIGLFCLAAAAVCVTFIFRKKIFWRLLLTGLLSIGIAVFPMALAYMLGTPLEGSLRWGMNIVKSTNTASDNINTQLQSPASQIPQSGQSPGENPAEGSLHGEKDGALGTDTEAQENQGVPMDSNTAGEHAAGRPSLWTKAGNLIRELNDALEAYIATPLGLVAHGFMFWCMIGTLLAGMIFCFCGDGAYGRILMGTALSVFLLCCVMISKTLGIPSIMDQSRCSTYLAYTLALLFGLAMDALLAVVFRWADTELLRQGLPVGTMVFLFLFLGVAGWIREPGVMEAMEKNGAILCVTNILRENKPKTYTIISANDELRMIERKGYFYEMSLFLHECEGERMEEYLVIPTPVIYVFIEKVPGENMAYSAYQGQPVSYQSAMTPLPDSTDYHLYKGTFRHVLMSRMYYWAQEFQRSYENEMTIYYEDEEFICYKILQNVYRPFDLSIDYGFNTRAALQ